MAWYDELVQAGAAEIKKQLETERDLDLASRYFPGKQVAELIWTKIIAKVDERFPKVVDRMIEDVLSGKTQETGEQDAVAGRERREVD